MLYGSGQYSYELVERWAKLPEGESFLDIGGISIDTQNRLYILNRSKHPIMIFDHSGNIVSTWG